MKYVDYLIVGAGAAGMAAALKIIEQGKSALLADRNERLGGVLLQCRHKGFGLGYFGEDLSGIEYANRFEVQIKEVLKREKSRLEVRLMTSVLLIDRDKKALLSDENGSEEIKFEKLILASGCREKAIGSVLTSGTRPSGIMTAGMAQRLLNIHGIAVGENIVILGTGDIGQILARDFIQKGKKVIAMIEKNDSPGGMKRNQENCIRKYQIPLMLNTELETIIGEKRIKAIEVIHKRNNRKEIIPCDTLITAMGLIPETSLLEESFGDEVPDWVIKLGNCNYVHDIVDSVTMEADKSCY